MKILKNVRLAAWHAHLKNVLKLTLRYKKPVEKIGKLIQLIELTVKYNLIHNPMTEQLLRLKFWTTISLQPSKDMLSDKRTFCVWSVLRNIQIKELVEISPHYQNGKLCLNYKASITKWPNCEFPVGVFCYRMLCVINESNFYAFFHEIIARSELAFPKIYFLFCYIAMILNVSTLWNNKRQWQIITAIAELLQDYINLI